MIRGTTRVFPVIGHPVEQVKAPEILNDYFFQAGIDAVVVPMEVDPQAYLPFVRQLLQAGNVGGVLVTIPHKRATLELLDGCSLGVTVSGACNAVRKQADGTLYGEIFDGIAFVECLRNHGYAFDSGRVLMVGAGGVGAAIGAALLEAGVTDLCLHDLYPQSASALAERLAGYFPANTITAGSNDPQGYDLVINASPLGMRDDDPLPVDVSRLAPATLVAEVVMKRDKTPLLLAAERRGCRIQLGREMFLAQKALYAAFFGLADGAAEPLVNRFGQHALVGDEQ